MKLIPGISILPRIARTGDNRLTRSGVRGTQSAMAWRQLATGKTDSPRASCLLCASGTELILSGLSDNRLGTPGTFEIRRCIGCGFEQTSPLPALAELKNLYEVHYNFGGEKNTVYTRFREWFLASPLFRVWLLLDGDNAFLARRGAGLLLDVGCNEGRGLSAYRRNGFAVEGLDLNPVAARSARERGYTVHEVPMENFQPADAYDVVVLSNVLEHTLDPRRMLFDAARILKPGGEVWISCPNSESWLRRIFGRSWINWHVPFHISHFFFPELAATTDRSRASRGSKWPSARPPQWVASSILVRLFARPGRATRELRNPVLFASLMLLVRALFFPVLFIANRAGKGDCLIAVARKEKES